MCSYKESGIPYVGKIPKHWNLKKNKRCFLLNKKIVGENFEDFELLSLTKRGIVYKDINNTFGKTPESYETYQSVKAGQLVMCLFDLDISAVFSGISSYDGMISPAYKVYDCKSIMYNKFAGYWFDFCFDGRKYMSYSKSLRYVVNAEDFNDINIIVPPLDEQEKIANFLDEKIKEIDNAIEKTKETIEDYKLLKKTIISKVMTKGLNKNVMMKNSFVDWIGNIPNHWIKCRIKTICEVGSGTTPQSGNELYYNETANYNWIQSGDIYGKKEILHTKDMVTQKALEDYSTLKIYTQPYIVIAMYGGSVGNAAISKINACTNQACGVLLPSSKIDINYLYYWIEFCKDNFLKTAEGGGQPNISQDKIKNQFFLLCDLVEQKSIVNYLDFKCNEIDKLIENKEKIVKELENYKKSVIYEYVTGKKEVK